MVKYIIYLFAVYNSSSITTVYVVTLTFSLTRALTTGPRSESKHWSCFFIVSQVSQVSQFSQNLSQKKKNKETDPAEVA